VLKHIILSESTKSVVKFTPYRCFLRCSASWAAIGIKGMSAKCPLFYSDLGAIGAVAGDMRHHQFG